MDRNTIIAFVLIGLILLLWPVFQTKIIGVPKPRQTQEQVSKKIPSDEMVQKQEINSAIQMTEKTGRHELTQKTNRENKRQAIYNYLLKRVIWLQRNSLLLYHFK